MKHNAAKETALGGVLAALAVVIMALGGMIPFATFACPLLCCILTKAVLAMTRPRTAWAWYGAVAMLSMLLSPDKEAAAVFVFLGYYPILKPWLDRQRLKWLWKGLLFNSSILVMYAILIHLLGMADIAGEFAEAGTVMTVVMLLLGNVTFFLLDRILGVDLSKRRRHG